MHSLDTKSLCNHVLWLKSPPKAPWPLVLWWRLPTLEGHLQVDKRSCSTLLYLMISSLILQIYSVRSPNYWKQSMNLNRRNEPILFPP